MRYNRYNSYMRYIIKKEGVEINLFFLSFYESF